MILENVSLAAPNSLRLAFAHLLLRPSRGNLVLGETATSRVTDLPSASGM